MSTKTSKPGQGTRTNSRRPRRDHARSASGPSPKRRRGRLQTGPKIALGIVAGVVALGAIFYASNRPTSGGGPATGGRYPFQVGSPGPGQQAPPIHLASTSGGNFDLASLRGQSVLLYFQEGLTCQPCWDQLKDIEANWGKFQALGIGSMATITTDPLAALKQKVADEGLSGPVLSDANLAVSNAYHTNSYGMMGSSRDGHSFIVVGPNGAILWRADFGGPPDYIMDVPSTALLADLSKGLHKAQP